MTTNTINSGDVSIPSTQTSVYDAIFGRRMTKEFTGAEVPRATLERLLDAAIWAPNHRLTNPWRFFVLEKDSPIRKQVAELAWQTAYDNVANPNPEQKKASADASKSQSPRRARHALLIQPARSQRGNHSGKLRVRLLRRP